MKQKILTGIMTVALTLCTISNTVYADLKAERKAALPFFGIIIVGGSVAVYIWVLSGKKKK